MIAVIVTCSNNVSSVNVTEVNVVNLLSIEHCILYRIGSLSLSLYRPPISISPVHIADFEHQAAIQRLTVGMLFITFKSQCQIHYRLLYILCNYPKVQQLINTQFIAQCSLFFSPLLHSFAGNANLHDTMLLTVVHVESS